MVPCSVRVLRGTRMVRIANQSGCAFASSTSASSVLLGKNTFLQVRALSAGVSPRVRSLSSARSSWPAAALHFSSIAHDTQTVDSDIGATTTVGIPRASATSSLADPLSPVNGVVHDATLTPEFDEAVVLDDITNSKPVGNVAEAIAPLIDDASTEKEPEETPPEGMGPPITSFRLSPSVIDALTKNNIKFMTEVQAGTFDLLYDGADVIAKSHTGTGKTLAFALPIMEKLAIARRENGPIQRGEGPGCIVLAPTRELAKQVAREMGNLGKALGLRVECFYGGASYTPQENALRRGLDVVVGTPGRIIDFIEKGALMLHNIKFAVLDEADEMLSMGFSQDVEAVFETLPDKSERQVILFSATVPHWVKNLAAQYQKSDVEMFDAVGRNIQTATTVRHCAVRVPERDESRAALLADIVAVYSQDGASEDGEPGEPSRAIVFAQTKREADELVACGSLDGCGAAVLHGDVAQRQREITLSQFRSGKFKVLVATDVAARGLDISGVDVVVQYRVPRDTEAYIHRAGRTGRAGRSGTAVVLYSDRELRALRDLERDCKIDFSRDGAPAPEAALNAAVEYAKQMCKTVDERVTTHLDPSAQAILDLPEEERKNAVASLLAVAARRTRLEDRSILSGEEGMRTLHVKEPGASHGRFLTPAVVMRTLTNITESLDAKLRVGLIRICRDGSAVVDVPSSVAKAVLELSVTGTDLEIGPAVNVPPLREDSDRRGGRDRDFNRGGRFGGGRDRYGGRRDYRGGRDARGGYGGGRRERYGSRDDSWGRRGGGGDRFRSRSRDDFGDYRRDRNNNRNSGFRDGDYGNRRSSHMLHDDF